MTIDHVGIQVRDLERSRVFYSRALAVLGITFIRDVGGWAGFGKDGCEEFWIGTRPTTPQSTHVGFRAKTREQVEQFYAGALAAGGTSKSAPRLFPEYHPDFYAAMVLDPDGHNIEVVCHAPG